MQPISLDLMDVVTLSLAASSLVISSLLAMWGLGRQKRFHTFEIVSNAHGRVHQLARQLAAMKREGRFDVREILDLVRAADELFATVDPYLRLSRNAAFKAADAKLQPGQNLQDAFADGTMERWLGLGREAIRRYLRLA